VGTGGSQAPDTGTQRKDSSKSPQEARIEQKPAVKRNLRDDHKSKT
jgi:hypothetical protein